MLAAIAVLIELANLSTVTESFAILSVVTLAFNILEVITLPAPIVAANEPLPLPVTSPVKVVV